MGILPSWAWYLASLFEDAAHGWNQPETSSGNCITDGSDGGGNDALRMNSLHGKIAFSLGVIIPFTPL
jgi:hypothetical protein